MSKKIVIDPVTRVEGHGKVTINLDESGIVRNARFHIAEFRGFERFIQGHPYWEVPSLVQRLCGICPVSHHLAAAKAIDHLHGLGPDDIPQTAIKLRRLLHYGQVFQSHALHFFYLASPDLLFGTDAPPEKRNVVAVAGADPELAKKGILMRKFGQEIIKAISGKRIHGTAAIPGGNHKTFSEKERDRFLDGKEIPNVDTMVNWSLETLDRLKALFETQRDWLDSFAVYPSSHLGLVREGDGALELYDGRLRAVNWKGEPILEDVSPFSYREHFAEGVESWSYLKFPYLKQQGRASGWNRVGPLARMNVCDYIPTPLAERERKFFRSFTGDAVNNRTMYYHWARLIETLHCAEVCRNLLHDPEILGDDLVREGARKGEGIGVLEAPRGTLIHHYKADEKGMVTWANLIVSTTHNNEPMNKAVATVARAEMTGHAEITEPMMNRIEVAIRAYDPCLSCATHAIGQMPLKVTVFDHMGNIRDERVR